MFKIQVWECLDSWCTKSGDNLSEGEVITKEDQGATSIFFFFLNDPNTDTVVIFRWEFDGRPKRRVQIEDQNILELGSLTLFSQRIRLWKDINSKYSQSSVCSHP